MRCGTDGRGSRRWRRSAGHSGRSSRADRAKRSCVLAPRLRPQGDWFPRSPEAEGGCGVTGFACTIPVGGKHIYEPSIQMRNRGNGKGGGIAACGLVPEDMGVSRKVLDEDYILQVALLDPTARGEVEKTFIEPFFDVDQGGTDSDGGRLPRRAAVGGPPARRGPLLRPRQARRAGPLRRRKRAGQGRHVRAGRGRRVRLPELASG